MIVIDGIRMVEHVDELPDFTGAKYLYVDFETTSLNEYEKAVNWSKGHRIAGCAITADDREDVWYVPVRHWDITTRKFRPGQISIDDFQVWLKAQIESCEEWVNHNVKFDAHFAARDTAWFKGRLNDTMTQAKLLDSDRLYKGGYGLKALSEHWLEEKITDKQDKVKEYLKNVKLPRNKRAQDFGLVPQDIMAPYAGQDVISNRRLHKYLLRRMPEEMSSVSETEILLTAALFDIEEEGMPVDPDELIREEFKALMQMSNFEAKIHQIIGYPINPVSTDDCYEVLCNHYGLPVLAYNDSGNPSFDKNALKQYLAHPDVVDDENKVAVVNAIREYRHLNTLVNTFIRPYQEQNAEGVLHPDYNQAVRSGRMSCKRPNAQQLSKQAKKLIHPKDGEAFLCCDYRQIEFRLIVHYIRDEKAILAYENDPETDFHDWVAEMCGIPRRPAKNVNFAIGYGAGKKKVTTMLAANMELMEGFGHVIDDMIKENKIGESERKERFDSMCRQRAREVFETYHGALPGLRPTTRAAARKILSKGYVFNAYGRRAHLSEKAAHIAFNRVIQGCAADIMKERTVALAPRYNKKMRDWGLRLCWSVHDETGITGPKEVLQRPEVVKYICETLEDTAQKFSIPIRTSAGYSEENWAIASGDEGEVEIVR